MAHPQQRRFVESIKIIFPKFFREKKILEVGSLDINGSVRDLFEDCDYLGIDVGEGQGVDLVCEGQNFNAPNETFDVSLSTECFEHNPFWLQTFLNMIRVTKSKGLIFFTCATEGRAEHGTTRTSPGDSPLTVGKGWEYYMNLTERHFYLVDFDSLFNAYSFSTESDFHDLYFFGVKK